jgi:hypothetical protein
VAKTLIRLKSRRLCWKKPLSHFISCVKSETITPRKLGGSARPPLHFDDIAQVFLKQSKHQTCTKNFPQYPLGIF